MDEQLMTTLCGPVHELMAKVLADPVEEGCVLVATVFFRQEDGGGTLHTACGTLHGGQVEGLPRAAMAMGERHEDAIGSVFFLEFDDGRHYCFYSNKGFARLWLLVDGTWEDASLETAPDLVQMFDIWEDFRAAA